jgi:general secretion pathway protein E
MDYLRIDPLKVDVGKVADAMSAAYAERHRVLPVQVTASEMVVATSEPFITDWVAEVERQSRRSVRRCWPARRRSTASRPSFMRWPSRCKAANKSGANNGATV